MRTVLKPDIMRSSIAWPAFVAVSSAALRAGNAYPTFDALLLRAQIKLLKTLALLGAGNKAASENMYAVVGDAMRRANTGHTIGNAIVYECVRTIAAIFPNPALLQSGAHRLLAQHVALA